MNATPARVTNPMVEQLDAAEELHDALEAAANQLRNAFANEAMKRALLADADDYLSECEDRILGEEFMSVKAGNKESPLHGVAVSSKMFDRAQHLVLMRARQTDSEYSDASHEAKDARAGHAIAKSELEKAQTRFKQIKASADLRAAQLRSTFGQ